LLHENDEMDVLHDVEKQVCHFDDLLAEMVDVDEVLYWSEINILIHYKHSNSKRNLLQMMVNQEDQKINTELELKI